MNALLDYCIKNNFLTAERAAELEQEAQQVKTPVYNILSALHILPEEEVWTRAAQSLHCEYINLKKHPIDEQIIKAVSVKIAHYYKIVPFESDGRTLKIAINDPTHITVIDDIRMILKKQIIPYLASQKDIEDALKKYYGVGAETVEKMMSEEGAPTNDMGRAGNAEDIQVLDQEASLITFVNQILLQAYHDRSTDIHFEPYEDELRIRFRIDGILYDTSIPENIKHFANGIVSRIKIMAHLNIAERRLPQDGRIKVKVGDKELDLRVSILPTPFGEAVNIRVLTSESVFYGIEKLGLRKDNLTLLDTVLKKPHGIILVTGPTGSGKTTTLYACLAKLNDSRRKIITIEDPIEYLIKGITQIQIHPKIGLTFAAGLRSMLRHNPDIMMVGEIRDMETAEITIRIALTGHLVFSTLHTNDAPGAVTRLLDMNIEPYLITSSVECVIAQRLVRVLCDSCKRPLSTIPPYIVPTLKRLNHNQEPMLYYGKGCDLCKQTGFLGRTAIYEIMILTDDIRNLVLERAPSSLIKKKALEQGMHTLKEDGLLKAMDGMTSLEEVLRVSQDAEV